MTTALLVGGVALLSGCNQQPETPALGIKEFMAQEVQPTAQVYWDSVRYISNETGIHHFVPETDADWERTRKAAAGLSAYGELLKSPAYAEGRGADWIQFSQGLVDVGKRAELAAEHKSVEEVFEVGATIYNVCSACHQVYPPAAGEVPNATATGGDGG
ncbi:MAG: hypothetical protein P8Y58_07175 [Novosphingobium sp.]